MLNGFNMFNLTSHLMWSGDLVGILSFDTWNLESESEVVNWLTLNYRIGSSHFASRCSSGASCEVYQSLDMAWSLVEMHIVRMMCLQVTRYIRFPTSNIDYLFFLKKCAVWIQFLWLLWFLAQGIWAHLGRNNSMDASVSDQIVQRHVASQWLMYA